MTGDGENTRPAAGAEVTIDAVVRTLMSAEAPDDLRARVLARLVEPPAPRQWPARARLGWVGAAAAAILVAYLAWPRTSAPPIDSAVPAAAGLRLPPSPVALPPENEAPEPRSAPRRPDRHPRATRETPVPSPRPYQFVTSPVVTPLEEPPPVVIEPLAERRVAIEPLGIEPLTFTPVTIDPLPAGR